MSSTTNNTSQLDDDVSTVFAIGMVVFAIGLVLLLNYFIIERGQSPYFGILIIMFSVGNMEIVFSPSWLLFASFIALLNIFIILVPLIHLRESQYIGGPKEQKKNTDFESIEVQSTPGVSRRRWLVLLLVFILLGFVQLFFSNFLSFIVDKSQLEYILIIGGMMMLNGVGMIIAGFPIQEKKMIHRIDGIIMSMGMIATFFLPSLALFTSGFSSFHLTVYFDMSSYILFGIAIFGRPSGKYYPLILAGGYALCLILGQFLYGIASAGGQNLILSQTMILSMVYSIYVFIAIRGEINRDFETKFS